ncbi:MAG TPA: peptidase S41, partial [Pelotomaculum sp.]|nr:peptidase S41 [Pelotomaculum sp.]
DIAEESLSDIVQKIQGLEGTRVRLTIRRDGRDDFDIELLRSSINLPSVQGQLLDDGIGYITIDIFGSSTADDFGEALTTLKKKGAEKLILDLRNDPGGYLQAAIQIAGDFVEKGRVVVSIVDSNNERQNYYTEGNMLAGGMPVAILVNRASASASEALAGALQDYGVAVLIGDRTFGKGTVQTVIPLEAGGALKLTTAKYHTPNDRVIDHTGLAPDIQILTPELQLEAAKNWLSPPDKTTVILENGGTEAIVNESAVKLWQAPLRQGDTIYLPLRFVFEALGYRVDWQPSDGSIKVTDNRSEAIFYPGEEGRVLSGGQVETGAEPLLHKNETTYAPLSSLSFFNLKVEVDNGRITIEK